MLIFAEGGKPENPEKNPRGKGENQQQTPFQTPISHFRNELRTGESLLPQRRLGSLLGTLTCMFYKKYGG
jgi:hypothetical protein